MACGKHPVQTGLRLLPRLLQAAQDALLKRARANSAAQLGKYDPSLEDESAGDRTYEKNYVY